MSDLGVVRRAADLLVRYPFEPWFYGDSVGVDALVAASEVLEDPSYESFALGLARGAFGRDRAWRELDNTTPGHALVGLAQRHHDTQLSRTLAALASNLLAVPRVRGVPISMATAGLRAPYGGEPLTPAEAALIDDPGPAVYLDCMHFDLPFLSAWAKAVDDDARLSEAVVMAEAYIDLLQQDDGLFRHFYLQRTESSYIPGWGRGQGWALLGLVDTIECLGRDDPRAQRLRYSLQQLVDAMVARQLNTGHWPALLTDPSSPPESSTAAFFAAGLFKAMRLGLVSDHFTDAAARSLQAVRDSVDSQGQLRNVSAVVWSSIKPSHYAHVSVDHLVPWGQGPLILALVEALRYGRGATM